MSDALPLPALPEARFAVKCGRCNATFATRECGKLDHFSIFRIVCPHCRWPGRYLASELRALPARRAQASAKPAA